jgi:hypothetical protein
VARGRVIGHPRSDYDPRTRRIKRISAKSGKVRTPVPRLVSDALEVLLPHDATRLIVNSRGRPWTPDGFRVSVFKLLGALEEEGRVGPGSDRPRVASYRRTICARPGSNMLGQDTAEMAEWYARKAVLDRKLGRPT